MSIEDQKIHDVIRHAMNSNVNLGVVEQQDKGKPLEDPNVHSMVDMNKKFGQPLNEYARLDARCYCMRLPELEDHAKALEGDWPMVKSALEQYSIGCWLSLVSSTIYFGAAETTDMDTVVRARQLFDLLYIGVPAHHALQVLNGAKQCDIIQIGFQRSGLCTIHDIREDEFVDRWKRVMDSLKELAELTCCAIFVRGNFVATMGSSSGLKILRKIVEYCIVRNMPPASSIKIFKMLQVTKRLKALRVE